MSKGTDNNNGMPADFPPRTRVTAISGAQPKIAVALVDGKYYAPGNSPHEMRADWEMCEDLAHQLVPYCRKKLPRYKSRKITLAQVHEGVLAKKWCSPEQSFWMIRRTAALLGWPLPREVVMRAGRAGLRFPAETDPGPT